MMIQTLTRIQNAGWKSIIAGGAIRDLYHNIPRSDVDIYVKWDKTRAIRGKQYFGEQSWADYWYKTLGCKDHNRRLFDRDTVEFEGGFYGLNSTKICGVWDILKSNERFQLILLDHDPIDYVENCFDFGICKAWCDGYKIRFTRDFMHDSRYRLITLVNHNLSQREYAYAINHHLPKLQEKYPGYLFGMTLEAKKKFDKPKSG